MMKVGGSLFHPPAAPHAVDHLRRVLPPVMPSDYFEFLLNWDGCEIWFEDGDPAWFDCIQIYPVAEILSSWPTLKDLIPHVVIIGSDQGGQYLGYDTSVAAPWPLITCLPGYGKAHVAGSMTDLEKRYFRPVGALAEPGPCTWNIAAH